MNTKQIIAAAALAFVGASASVSAFAFEGDSAPQPVSTLSRAAVQADLAAAIADKTLPTAGEAGSIAEASKAVASTLSRDEVRAQTRAYVRSGQAKRDAQTLSALGG